MFICPLTLPKGLSSVIFFALFTYVLLQLNIKPTSKATFSKLLAGEAYAIYLYNQLLCYDVHIYIQITILIVKRKHLCDLWKISHTLKVSSSTAAVHHSENSTTGLFC